MATRRTSCCYDDPHSVLHWPVNMSLCKELRRRCDLPECEDRRAAEIRCGKCKVVTYCRRGRRGSEAAAAARGSTGRSTGRRTGENSEAAARRGPGLSWTDSNTASSNQHHAPRAVPQPHEVAIEERVQGAVRVDRSASQLVRLSGGRDSLYSPYR